MTADRSQVRFYVDESALGLGKALEAARKDTIYCGHKLITECPVGTADTTWIPIVANMGYVAIGRDKRVRTRENEVALIVAHGLRVFSIAPKRDLSTWEWLGIMMRNWDAMEGILIERPNGPWFYALSTSGPPKERQLTMAAASPVTGRGTRTWTGTTRPGVSAARAARL